MLELPLWVRLRAEAGKPTDFKTLTRINKFLRVLLRRKSYVEIRWKRGGRQDYGRDVCLIFGFQNIGDALTKKVKKAYKTSLHAICEMHMTPASNNEGRAVDK